MGKRQRKRDREENKSIFTNWNTLVEGNHDCSGFIHKYITQQDYDFKVESFQGNHGALQWGDGGDPLRDVDFIHANANPSHLHAYTVAAGGYSVGGERYEFLPEEPPELPWDDPSHWHHKRLRRIQ